MQIIIDISRGIFDLVQGGRMQNGSIGAWTILKAVSHGTPLPERHGRLIDADAYIDKHVECGWLDDITVDEFNKITPTIIPATKEAEDNVCWFGDNDRTNDIISCEEI